MNKKLLKLLFVCLLFATGLQSQVKIATYNLLGYPGNDTTIRNPYFRTVISSINPDILVVQEITSQTGVNAFLNGILNYEGNYYQAGTFIDGPDTDNAIFYRVTLFNFISNMPIKTALRDINEFKLVHTGTNELLRIYSVHLKASSGTANELLRAAEVDSLRKVTNDLPFNTNFIVCGDFNIYRSGEPAYQRLLEVMIGNEGHVNDMLSLTGTWNNSIYAIYHTQSTRVRSFGGGSTGGLDDRFDMILYSNAVRDPGGIMYVTNSLTPYGNDGNHFNDSINKPPNLVVSQLIADALHYTSDHLPVFALFTFTPTNVKKINSVNKKNFILEQNYPNPFNPFTKIRFEIPVIENVIIKIYNSSGKEINTLVNQRLNNGVYETEFRGVDLASGVYYYKMEAGNFIEIKKMMLIK